MLRHIMDAERLIVEVKRRPVLYDGRNADANARKHQWEEVAAVMFPEVWATADATEKDTLVKEMQVKWKGMRDSYMRSRKAEREEQKGTGKPRKKYVFYEKLGFLQSVTTFRNTTRSVSHSPGVNQDEDGEESMDEESNMGQLMDTNAFFSQDATVKTDQHQHQDDVEEAAISSGDPQNRPEGDLATILGELVRMQREERTGDRMGNRKFLLSLLPFMEKLPDDVNLEVRLQLMSLVHTYSNGDSLMTNRS